MCPSQGGRVAGAAGEGSRGDVWVLGMCSTGVGPRGLAGHLSLFLQTFQQELDTVVNTVLRDLERQI